MLPSGSIAEMARAAMHSNPVVSILVPYVHASWIDSCLESIRACAPAEPYEVLVLANGEEAMSHPLRPAFAQLGPLASHVNLGFSGGMNWLAAHARGEFLVLMNDDTEVTPGWLDATLSALRDDERAGVAGGTLIAPDGRVEESGRVLWRDGVSSAIGAGARTTASAAAREVDTCSACGLVVRRTAWEAAGGLDERYYPAYYEDSDLALELRRRGWRILCAPRSQIRHRGSASTSPLWRHFLGLRNHVLFTAKWSRELELFDPRPRDEPLPGEIADTLRGVARRSRRIYDEARMDGGNGDSPRSLPSVGSDADAALLQQELDHARAELQVKDEYIAFLQKNLPSLERALAHQLAQERRATQRHEMVRRIPGVGAALAAARRAGRRINGS